MMARFFALLTWIVMSAALVAEPADTRVAFKGSRHQHEFIASQDKYVALMGGYGAGKSYALAHKCISLSAQNPGLPGALIGGDFPRLKRDVLPILFDALHRAGIKYEYKKVDREIILEPRWWGSTIHLMSVDAPERLKGPTLAWIAGDEPGTWPDLLATGEKTWDVLISRIRHPLATLRQIALTGTPEGEENWFSREFVSGPDDLARRTTWATEYRCIHTTTYHNRHLPRDYIKALESSYDAVQIREKLHGLPTARTGGLAYYAFNRSLHVRPVAYDKWLGPVRVGMDFNVDPMAAVLWQRRPDNVAQVFGEVLIPGSSTWEMARALKAIARELHVAVESLIVYPDPAGKSRSTKGISDIDILRREGIRNLRVPRKAPAQRDRLNVMNGMLAHGRLIVDPKATATIRDLARVKTRPMPSGIVEIDKRDPQLTHPSDGLGYALFYEFPIRVRKLGLIAA